MWDRSLSRNRHSHSRRRASRARRRSPRSSPWRGTAISLRAGGRCRAQGRLGRVISRADDVAVHSANPWDRPALRPGPSPRAASPGRTRRHVARRIESIMGNSSFESRSIKARDPFESTSHADCATRDSSEVTELFADRSPGRFVASGRTGPPRTSLSNPRPAGQEFAFSRHPGARGGNRGENASFMPGGLPAAVGDRVVKRSGSDGTARPAVALDIDRHAFP